MSLLGIQLTLLIGPAVAVPAPLPLSEALDRVEVTNTDEGRSGFQITFRAGRATPLEAVDDPLFLSPLLRPFNRVVLIVTFGVIPRVISDGLITDIQLDPGSEPGTGTITVTGEDVALAMDRDDEIAEHPAQPDLAIVAKLIAKYARYGLIPVVIPPKAIDPPLPVERVPVQQGTDLEYLVELGRRHGHVFYVAPGPLPLQNQAYWGPPQRVGFPQRALSVNFGAQTNVRSIDFQHSAIEPTLVDGNIQDRRTNVPIPVRTFVSTRIPLSSQPEAVVGLANLRTQVYRKACSSTVKAFGEAQSITDFSTDQVVSATGELDALRYGDALRARALVGLRGAGFRFDGLYYVKSVTHKLSIGDYTQSFTLTRDGVGSITPAVRP